MTITVPAELQERVAETIAAWEEEANLWEGWREVPDILGMSRRRLPTLVALSAPDLIIENEIRLTRTRIAQMRQTRMKALH